MFKISSCMILIFFMCGFTSATVMNVSTDPTKSFKNVANNIVSVDGNIKILNGSVSSLHETVRVLPEEIKKVQEAINKFDNTSTRLSIIMIALNFVMLIDICSRWEWLKNKIKKFYLCLKEVVKKNQTESQKNISIDYPDLYRKFLEKRKAKWMPSTYQLIEKRGRPKLNDL